MRIGYQANFFTVLIAWCSGVYFIFLAHLISNKNTNPRTIITIATLYINLVIITPIKNIIVDQTVRFYANLNLALPKVLLGLTLLHPLLFCLSRSHSTY